MTVQKMSLSEARQHEEFDREIEQEPARVQAFYALQATRVEPVGIVYLWPASN